MFWTFIYGSVVSSAMLQCNCMMKWLQIGIYLMDVYWFWQMHHTVVIFAAEDVIVIVLNTAFNSGLLDPFVLNSIIIECCASKTKRKIQDDYHVVFSAPDISPFWFCCKSLLLLRVLNSWGGPIDLHVTATSSYSIGHCSIVSKLIWCPFPEWLWFWWSVSQFLELVQVFKHFC